MLRSLLHSSGLFLRLLLLLLALTSTVGCTGNPLSLLTGGGPNVAANTQLGQQNNQTIGNSETVTIKDVKGDVVQSSNERSIKADNIQSVTVIEYPVWLIIAFVVAILMDSPIRMLHDLGRIFTRKKE